MAEIAIFGGTFDPPTRAHEAITAACLAQKTIDEVWLLPSGVRADKDGMASSAARLAMLEVMRTECFDADPRLHVSDFELNLPLPTQTVSTVAALEQAYPEHNWWFVFGADSYETMPAWEGGTELQQNLGMLLVPRAGYELPAEGGNIQHIAAVEACVLGISSTKVRTALREGKPVDELVTDPIQAHIVAEQLYGAVQ